MNTIELMKKEIQALPKVWSVDIQVNQTDYFDHYHQLPPHSIRVIVEGGKKKKIANAIYKWSTIGMRFVGNTEVIIDTGWGFYKTISFERVGK